MNTKIFQKEKNRQIWKLHPVERQLRYNPARGMQFKIDLTSTTI